MRKFLYPKTYLIFINSILPYFRCEICQAGWHVQGPVDINVSGMKPMKKFEVTTTSFLYPSTLIFLNFFWFPAESFYIDLNRSFQLFFVYFLYWIFCIVFELLPVNQGSDDHLNSVPAYINLNFVFRLNLFPLIWMAVFSYFFCTFFILLTPCSLNCYRPTSEVTTT